MAGHTVNWFVIIIGVQFLGAAAWSAYQGRWWWASLYLMWGLGDFVIAMLEVKRV